MQDVRADLRMDFLKIIRNLEGKSAGIRLYGDSGTGVVSSEVIAKNLVIAFDREMVQVLVAPLKTPNGETLPSAILRLTDVESLTYKEI
jgi:hypothetical protein